MKSSIAIAALVVASIATAAPSFAQSAPDNTPDAAQPAAPAAPPTRGPELDPDAVGPDGPALFAARAMGPHRAMGPGALLMLACSPRGAEALDVALLRLSYRLDLTAEQKPLFDAFHQKALATQASFADSCKSAAPAAADNGRPDFLARLKARLSVDQARLTALNDVLPSFEALYDTLSDTQKAALLPHRPGFGPKAQNGMHAGRRAIASMVR